MSALEGMGVVLGVDSGGDLAGKARAGGQGDERAVGRRGSPHFLWLASDEGVSSDGVGQVDDERR